ncbi:hypothetical protein BJX70DRAFT_403920 [Aspergillus crustosus]
MERFYVSGCRDYSPDVQPACLALAKVGSFACSQMLCTLLIICSLLHKYIFTASRLSRIYGLKYSTLPPPEKRHLRLVHVGIVMKFVAVPTMALPIYLVNFGGYRWSDNIAPYITLLDLTAFSGCSLGASALFDLSNDDSIRPLYVIHHLTMVFAIQGTGALIMSLPTNNERRILEIFQAFKAGLTWVLFSSVGSTVSRVTYLFRKLFAWPPETLCKLFLINFLTFASATILEAIIIVYFLGTRWDQLPTEVVICMLLFQTLFTVTKSKTVNRLFMVYKSQETEVRKQLETPTWGKAVNGRYEK